MQKSLERNRGFAYESVYTNPMIRKIMRMDEVSTDCATYSSIGNKCAFFMAMIIAGILLFGILQMINPQTIALDEETTMVISTSAMVGGAFFGLIFVITPFIAMLIKRTIPVTGTLYCFSVGYTISLLSQIIPDYKDAVSLALLVTIAIVTVMAIVYSRGWIKVDQKFRNIAKILLFTSILSSLLVVVCYFIPQLKGIALFFMGNSLLSIGISIVYIIIAALFLLVDFNAIQHAVENKMPRKYEWIAAFGLAFSVIWLFLKVLDVIIKLTSKSSSDK